MQMIMMNTQFRTHAHWSHRHVYIVGKSQSAAQRKQKSKFKIKWRRLCDFLPGSTNWAYTRRRIEFLPKSIGSLSNRDAEKSTPSVLPLPVIHTSSLADAQVLASFTSSQVNTGTNIYCSWMFKNNSWTLKKVAHNSKNPSWNTKTKSQEMNSFTIRPRLNLLGLLRILSLSSFLSNKIAPTLKPF